MMDELRGGQPIRRIHNDHFISDFPFHGLSQMVLTLNEICNALKRPQAALEIRSFSRPDARIVFSAKEERTSQEVALREGANKVYPREVKKGERCSFSIKIICRQHGSMQERLIALGKKPKRNCFFRSSLELEYLMAEVMGISPEPLE